MVEGKALCPPILDPFGRCRVVARARISRHRQLRQISDADSVPSRVPAWVRIHAHEQKVSHLEVRLFLEFSPTSVFDGLADIHEASGQRVTALEGLVPPANEQDTPL